MSAGTHGIPRPPSSRAPSTSTPARSATSTGCRGGRAADGGQRPDLGVRLRARDHDPRQGRRAHPDVAVVVRAARRPGPEPRALGRRTGGGARAARWSASASRCTPSSASPAATSPAPACATTPRPARSAASRCPTGWSTAAGSPEPIFTPATKAELGDHDENVSYDAVVGEVGAEAAAAPARPDAAVYGRGRGDRPRARASSWPTPSSSSAPAPTARSCSPTRCSPPTRRGSGRPTTWQPGRAQPSYDKHIVRGWLTSPASGWDRTSGRGRRRRCPTRSSSGPGRATSRPTSGSPAAPSDHRAVIPVDPGPGPGRPGPAVQVERGPQSVGSVQAVCTTSTPRSRVTSWPRPGTALRGFGRADRAGPRRGCRRAAGPASPGRAGSG